MNNIIFCNIILFVIIMKPYIYLVFGMAFIMLIIKIIIPKPIMIKLLPNLSNYNDITYIDEEGKIYKYDLYAIT